MAETFASEVAVVGAGPAGIAAACRAAESGATTLLLDEGLAPGGQIHRHLPGDEPPAKARPWLERLSRSGARVLSGASVFDAEKAADGFFLRVSIGESALFVRSRRLVLAAGARELFLPFPGWTLPGVIGVGAAQALIKNGAEVRGRTAVVAGSGPLLLAAAALLVKAGARVALVAEQAEWRSLLGFGGALLRSPGKILEALRYRLAFAASRYRAGTWIAQVRGDGSVSQVVVSDGRRSRDLRCDLLCVGYGLVPNLELPRLLGCVVQPDRAAVDERQETSVAGVFAAGEICGVAGAEAASAEGEIAGLAAAGVLHPGEPGVQRLLLARARARRFGEALATAFRLRSEVLDLASPETIVCRCEDVSLSLLASAASMREAKLHTRLGMGPCQGRVCGGALQALRGFAPDSVRPPLVPVPLEALASLEEKE